MHRSVNPDHAHHDLNLIAGHAAGDLANLDIAATAALLASCTTCAEVHRDLVAISSATRALPRTARSPRDFRLTADQAERLRRGSWLRGLLRPFASARSATRPMARAFTSIGVAGLLVVVLQPGGIGLMGGAAAGPTQQEDSAYVGAAASEGPELAPGAAGAPSGDPVFNGDADATQMALAADESPGVRDGGTKVESGGERLVAETPKNLLLLGSLALLALGIVLFGVRFAARRLR